MALRDNFSVTKKFLIAKFNCNIKVLIVISNKSLALKKTDYHTHAIMSHGLNIFYPVFEDHKICFQGFFSENSPLLALQLFNILKRIFPCEFCFRGRSQTTFTRQAR